MRAWAFNAGVHFTRALPHGTSRHRRHRHVDNARYIARSTLLRGQVLRFCSQRTQFCAQQPSRRAPQTDAHVTSRTVEYARAPTLRTVGAHAPYSLTLTVHAPLPLCSTHRDAACIRSRRDRLLHHRDVTTLAVLRRISESQHHRRATETSAHRSLTRVFLTPRSEIRSYQKLSRSLLSLRTCLTVWSEKSQPHGLFAVRTENPSV